MSTLSGQTIQSTYQGLLKLADSTSGITSNYQDIQDGLGNNTGIKIKQNFLSSPNMWQAQPYKGDFYGLGISNNNNTYNSGNTNVITAALFWDAGIYEYSAITYNLVTAAPTENVSVAFYDCQFIDGIGLTPNNLIYSGISLSTSTPTGIQTTILNPNLSFSAYGSDYFFMCVIPSTTASTPSVIYRTTGGLHAQTFPLFAGFVWDRTRNSAQTALKGVTNTAVLTYSGVTSFTNPFPSNQANNISTTSASAPIGFMLNTVK